MPCSEAQRLAAGPAAAPAGGGLRPGPGPARLRARSDRSLGPGPAMIGPGPLELRRPRRRQLTEAVTVRRSHRPAPCRSVRLMRVRSGRVRPLLHPARMVDPNESCSPAASTAMSIHQQPAVLSLRFYDRSRLQRGPSRERRDEKYARPADHLASRACPAAQAGSGKAIAGKLQRPWPVALWM